MKRYSGPVRLTGTLKNSEITFYERDGQSLWRQKSSLTGERVKNDPAFEGSRKASDLFGEASKLAKKVYRDLPKDKRKHGVIGKLTGLAVKLLKEGSDETQTILKIKESMGG